MLSWMVAAMRYSPPSCVVKVQETGSASEPAVHSCTSASFSTQLPASYFHCRRAARIWMGRSATGLPSRSVTMASMISGSPASTKVRALRKPT